MMMFNFCWSVVLLSIARKEYGFLVDCFSCLISPGCYENKNHSVTKRCTRQIKYIIILNIFEEVG